MLINFFPLYFDKQTKIKAWVIMESAVSLYILKEKKDLYCTLKRCSS